MVGIVNPPRGPRSILPSLNDKLKNIPKTCKSYAEPMVLDGKPFFHCKCEHYTGGLNEKLEYSCICCYNFQTPDGRYINRRDDDADYMQLYKKNPIDFLAYFSRCTNLSKKKILKDIFESDFVNEEVIAWLEKNEMDILREASFN